MNVTTCGTIIGFFRGLHVTEHRFQNLAPESDELGAGGALTIIEPSHHRTDTSRTARRDTRGLPAITWKPWRLNHLKQRSASRIVLPVMGSLL